MSKFRTVQSCAGVILTSFLILLAAAPVAGASSAPTTPSSASNPASTSSLSSSTVSAHGLGAVAPSLDQAPALPTGLQAHVALPTSVSLQSSMPPAGNQGDLGSCVSWAVGYTLYGYYVRTENLSGGDHAPMYLYSQVDGGVDDGSVFVGVPGDPGNLDTATAQGVDTETDYTQGNYDYTDQPTAAEHANAAHYKLLGYNTLFSGDTGQGASATTAIQQALFDGDPVVLGIPVYRPSPDSPGAFDDVSYDYAGPAAGESDAGGHAIVAVGYDSYGIIIENSWGTSWAKNGFADLSYSFINNYAFAAYTADGVATSSATTPAVTSISPTTGPKTGATSVTITGTNLTGTTAVHFGTVAATKVTVVSATSATATSPAGAAGAVDVTVTTPNGTSADVTGDKFTYTAPAPTTPAVTSISPTTGPTAGATSVTITGTNLTGTTAVHFGTVAATKVTVVSATSATATSPAGTAGAVDVTVTTPNGTSADVTGDKFTYTAPPVPAVTSISPTTGPTAGATSVTITGTNLTGATAVHFGTVAATKVTVVSATSATATSPAGAAGAVDVTVTTPNGTSADVTGDKFTYTAPPVPAVTSISPTTGPKTGATSVTITGTNLTGTTAVHFGTVAATKVTVVSATSATATSPAGAAGAVDVTVTTPNGTSADVTGDKFTYTAPVVTFTSPASGSALNNNQSIEPTPLVCAEAAPNSSFTFASGFVGTAQPDDAMTLPSGSTQYFYVGAEDGGHPLSTPSWSPDLSVTAAYSNDNAISIGRASSDSASYKSETTTNDAIAGIGISGYKVSSVVTSRFSQVGPGINGGPWWAFPGPSTSLTYSTTAGQVVLILVGGQGTGLVSQSGTSLSTLVNDTYSQCGSDVIASAAMFAGSPAAGSHTTNFASTTFLTNQGTSLGAVAYILSPM